ncbi:restriction endonuclease [Exilibacterium tricleocarpae]|uniref:Restriction endonuclease n=2 Tax=Exilibacterium tricleocarpae TaxID=2591008 RepID=A0A545T3Q6_9GAMM|nr:restriction endonuclease [Exilibacterium tricleocarpae]
MGSKSKIMDFVLTGINAVYRGGYVCDLFAGSASLCGAAGDRVPIHSNDIQHYSSILAAAYLTAWRSNECPGVDTVIAQATDIVEANKRQLGLDIYYHADMQLEEFNAIELLQQSFIEQSFTRPWHLFLQYYSGTWWSAQQCLWIDALRQVAERYRQQPCYPVILSALMFAMAYTSQGTGHYAQYRDAKTQTSMQDILIYRRRDLSVYFAKKFAEVMNSLPATATRIPHKITALDFAACLQELEGGTVYADPPYCFVHYSRFYHAIETLVLYDYPQIQQKNGIQVKGRYRENRHQSPFCIRTLVKPAFETLFKGIKKCGANLVLSYSNTGLITIDELGELASKTLDRPTIEILTKDHQHMTLGRQYDRHREVEECLLLIT